ncbi:MAG: exo-alpha-sialidase [Pirellulales bacterium]|nr:exo-alpha-sialidase [Pirellulales bacterium]
MRCVPGHRFAGLALIASILALAGASGLAAEPELDYRIERLVPLRGADGEGFDGKMSWMHARPGAIPPGAPGNATDVPIVVLTLQRMLVTGSDVFFAIQDLRTDDLGRTWAGPVEHATSLGRTKEPGGVTVVPSDISLQWHAATGKLLAIGHNVRYTNNRRPQPVRARETVYSVYDPVHRSWSPQQWLKMPNKPRFQNAGAGSIQRYDLPNGDILLPIYYKEPRATNYSSTVVRCRFDGRNLTYVEHGDELTVNLPRGLCEPSLTRLGDRFYLTLRNDSTGYVTRGTDGLHFDKPIPWTFDDGKNLGSYNTQQHWVTHGDGLFLVYTRRGANNNHVPRHRAPLFIAQVDPEKMRVLRKTERILVPELGAQLGNFGVGDVSPDEAWVVTTETMRPATSARYGSDDRVWIARILWNRPNRLVQP